MGGTKHQQVETIGTTTHKNKIRHTQKQSGTTTHSNKKTTLKIQTQTKQTRKTTHKKITFYYLFIEKMKNTYIIAIEKDGMPMFIKQKPMECICYIGRHYQNAYIFNSKKEAEKTRAERFENWRIEKQKFTK